MSAEPAECFVCQKHRGEIVVPGGAIYRDDLVFAGHKLVPADGSGYLGYLFVEPLRHVAGLADLTNEEAQRIGLLVSRLSRALKASEQAEHVYAVILGDHVPHLHVHLVARYPGAPQEYWGLKVDDWPDAPRGGAEAAEALCDRLRTALDTA